MTNFSTICNGCQAMLLRFGTLATVVSQQLSPLIVVFFLISAAWQQFVGCGICSKRKEICISIGFAFHYYAPSNFNGPYVKSPSLLSYHINHKKKLVILQSIGIIVKKQGWLPIHIQIFHWVFNPKFSHVDSLYLFGLVASLFFLLAHS